MPNDNTTPLRVTDDTVRRMAALAVNASSAMGMGYMHLQRRNCGPEEFNVSGGALSLDYHDGRMVKLRMNRDKDGLWTVPTYQVRQDYQSWASEYPTYAALAEAATKDAA